MPLTKIDTGAIKDDAINSAKIADGTVVASDVLDNTITGAKLASDIAISTSGNITTTGALTSTGIDDNATSTAITIDSSERVGIGTTSPETTLHIESSTASLCISQNNDRFLAFDVNITGNEDVQFITVDQADALAFGEKTNNQDRTIVNEHMRITNSGNVGIGTTSPGSKLDIYDGTINVDATSSFLTGTRYTSGTGSNNITLQKSQSATIGTQSALTNGSGIGGIITKASDGTSFLSATAIFSQIDGTVSTNSVPSRIIFSTNSGSTAASERMRITSSGNVGIGTSSPDELLHVNGNIQIEQDDIFYFDNTASKSYINRSNTGLNIRTSNGLPLKFLTINGSEAARIDSSGNVGIGTTSPSNLLHLTGPQNGTALQIANTVDTNGIRINAGVSGLANNAIQFLNNSGDSLLVIDGSNKSTIVGNIGPSGYRASFGDFEVKNLDGAGNPGGTLVLSNNDGSIISGQILGNLTFASYDSSGASTTGGVASIRAVASETYGSTSGANLRFYTHPSSANNGTVDGNMSERMRITSSGNVGIGTGTFLSPDSLLEIGIDNNNLGNQRLLTVGTTDSGGAGETGIYLGAIRTVSPSRGALISAYHNYASTNNCGLKFYTTSGGNTDATTLALTLSGANATVAGSLSKGSGSFKIDHPLPSKNSTHYLVHSFTESPQADLIYRGKVDLVSGTATVNIDTVSGMTEGTFVLLNRDIQCFTSNETGWTAVKGSVSGNTLTITAQDNTCTDTISWMVIGERQDQHMIDTDWTDENGKVIVEPLKEIEE